MKPFFTHKITFLLLLCLLGISCTEPYALQTNTFEDALVIEATITNEFKKQEIKLSRTYRFEEDGPTFEAGATVYITDNLGNQYNFDELGEKYVSASEFQALPTRNYTLHITTNDGKRYSSTTEMLTTVNEIQNIVPTVATKEGVRGVEININSFDPNNTSKYYRYEYEETYKIITPFWDSERAIIIPPSEPGGERGIGLIPRVGESKTCYSTDSSNTIILNSTVGLNEDRVHFPVRFISNKNSIIMHRYSILVRQYVQNLAAYTYYKTMKDLSGSGSILSQNQPGFFSGNIRSMTNPNEKIIGFFDVTSVSSKRIFFNYEDIFPGEPQPPYFDECEIRVWGFCFISENPECKGAKLLSAIESNSLLYLDHYYNTAGGYNVYKMVPPPCGDCTTFSSNIKPSFWID
ncbi:DUF4249 domain-containing protein [Flavobacterium sp.]|uniref:DUF4249 domain-containing protein n=1 Tax=Flavobacterium sp. TaxID=239 RepID=UPI003D6B4AD5